MRYYNIYYKNRLINNGPLTADDIKQIFEKRIVKKFSHRNKTFVDIPTSDLYIREYIKIS